MKRTATASNSPSKRARLSTAAARGHIDYDTNSDDDDYAAPQPEPASIMVAALPPSLISPPRPNGRLWTLSGAIINWDNSDLAKTVSTQVSGPDVSTVPENVNNETMDDAFGEGMEDPEALGPPPETFGPDLEKPTRHQGQSHRMSKILKIMPDLQSRILATFAHPQLGHLCSCGHPAAYRCLECFNAPMWCHACIVHEHRYNPFHHIERWDGKMFVRDALAITRPFDKSQFPVKDLSHIHLLVQTHPHPDPRQPRCPHRHPGDPDIGQFTIGDHNRFHTTWIEFCDFDKPQTAFTFTTMKQFHEHSLAFKKSAYNYVKALCQLSNNASPMTVADRYREFLFACRIWRYLTLQRRTGQAHGIDEFVAHRRAASLALQCPACPEVGFNMTPEEMANTSEEERHKYTLYLSGDGNFKLQRKKKQEDPDDFALNDGNTYFPPNEDFKAYVKLIKSEKQEELQECDHLNAARMQKISKFKNAVITGVVAVQCARHGFYMPQGMVDLSLGEGYGYTDYALVYALADTRLIRLIRFRYDIWCQYGVRLLIRIAQWFPKMSEIFEKISGAINKLHILLHKELCQIIYNLNWLLFVGMVCMEMIKTGWAEHNLTAGSMREMNDGHRHDVIDRTSDHWNWEKTVKLPEALTRLYRTAKSEQRSRTASFEALDKFQKGQRPEAVAVWETKDENPKHDSNGVWSSVFQINMKSGPPTHAAAYTKLLAQEAEAAATQSGDLISPALLAERDRERLKWLRASPTSTEEVLAPARQRLQSDIKALCKWQLDRVPELHKYMKEIDVDKPEKIRLLLPSDFSPADRARLKLSDLAVVEYGLCEGQAHDSIMELRTTIWTNNFNTNLKTTDIYGTSATTCAGNVLKSLHNKVQWAGDTYRRSWRSLRALGLARDDATLQPLSRDEQWGKGGVALKVSRSKDREPWFWSVQRPAGLDAKAQAAWEEEMDRVQWFRERALMKQANEEVEILDAEFECLRRWFTKNSEIWTKMAETEKRTGYSDDQGWRAYAHWQAAIYANLARECKTLWKKLPQLVIDDEIADAKKAKKEEEERERNAEEEPDYEEDYLAEVL
ncbi:hypothetical protein K438DRAFT_2023128 [Mycena galopus ATCC 62051]|nr:hypothetical protein K438DRAFT_2023128 [Mycena galopus ATCC 62051]